MSDERETVKSVERAFRIVDTVKEMGGAGVSDLADTLNMPKSTIHLHLSTLYEKGYLTKSNGIYQVSLRFVNYGEQAKRQQKLYTVSKSHLTELSNETGENVICMVEQHGLGTVINIERGTQGLHTDFRVGSHATLHCNASGKAILAEFSPETVDEIVGRWGLPSFTSKTFTDREKLHNELEEITSRGYAINTEEYMRGIYGVGTSIVVGEDNLLGAISISGPANRLEKEAARRDLAEQLLSVADKIEVNATFQ